jgi:hypothetical protein
MANSRFDLVESVIRDNQQLIADATSANQVNETVAPQLARAIIKQLPFEDDRFIYRAVVVVLGTVVVISVGVYAYLAAINVTIPEALVALASAAIGALAGLLAPSPRQ